MEIFTLSIFSQHLNSKFLFKREPAAPVEMELVEAQDVGSTQRHEQFSIVFRGPGDILLPQAMYQIEHGELGSLELFIVPIKLDQDGLYYEAVFNRPL